MVGHICLSRSAPIQSLRMHKMEQLLYRRRSNIVSGFAAGTRADKPHGLYYWTVDQHQASIADEPGSLRAVDADTHPTRE